MALLPADLKGVPFFLVGIKGTGMTALAELLLRQGALVSGSDVADTFYTDAILASLGIKVCEGFDPANLPVDTAFVIHSAAWDPAVHPELKAAAARNIPLLVYTKALGEFSARTDSSGVSGVHGKTTTTAMVGTIVQALGLPGSILVGSGVSNFGGRSTWTGGSDFFVAETCEYRRHFLDFSPRRIILTSLEPDHLDYFRDYEDMADAFVAYCERLPRGGALIWCADDPGAADIAGRMAGRRPDLRSMPYGFKAQGRWGIVASGTGNGVQHFSLRAWPELRFTLRVPGEHNLRNAAAAIAMAACIHEDRHGSLGPAQVDRIVAGLAAFGGTRRRSEILGEARGVLFVDDYGHHPTAIRTTLEGLRAFHPGRRLVVDFMSHTYSRTKALLDDFAQAFGAADLLILNDIYASAREARPEGVSGEILWRKAAAHHPDVRYIAGIDEAIDQLGSILEPGDLFVTMGAGDNWKIGAGLLARWQGREGASS